MSAKRVALTSLLVFVAASATLLWDLEAQSFHGDESQWIRDSLPRKLFREDPARWEQPWESWPLSFNPQPGGKYLLLLSLAAHGAQDTELQPWLWSRSDEANAAAGAMPSRRALLAGRRAMALFGALACALAFVLAARAAGPLAGASAALLLAANPLLRESSRRAMTDAPLLAFSALAALLTASSLETRRRGTRGALLLCAGAGAAAGLATAVKLNGLVAGVVFAVVTAASPEGRRDRPLRRAGAFAAAAAAVYLALNPLVLRHPVDGPAGMLRHYERMLALQQEQYGPALSRPGQRAAAVARQALRHGTLPGPAGAALLLVGLAALWGRRREGPWAAAVLGWAGATTVMTAALIPLDWARYHLPVVFCATLVAGAGAGALLEGAARRLRPEMLGSAHGQDPFSPL